MNTPNKISILRILMVPVFMIFLMFPFNEYSKLIAVAVFALASLTDGIDGYIARKYNQITTFGKFLDPLADKLLITAALVCLVELGFVSSFVAMIIIAREFIVTSFRIVAIGAGKVIAADIWGKFKTTAQIIAVIVILLEKQFLTTHILGNITMGIAVVLTIYSAYNYIAKNWDLIGDDR
ncbi:CDP-diacylglycerol--glycerol-3-phosphate 3-phosphatidyltransferase [Feifania hominis]|uniref:CDP-diacylglycerol--glycerol-3-phosphate 3-phosphatidyltransferase n=1 Tax=Feifania hominis TaxID=2763660 RepID=A0A926HVI3_9FIRM|nr:CDP-diacylglycerol--glycerol-3-phosphate 3-phosphatidyltransferase [Feifania hominis]MBC8537020.1 CDP-diacylglycerol--glycerol-3-phosphate 3-phosphatidyltransferase [Feifania hominis]